MSTIVHCTTNPFKTRQTDIGGTGLLLQEAARAFREGAQLAPDRAYGKIRWEEFLRETVHRQRLGEAGRKRAS